MATLRSASDRPATSAKPADDEPIDFDPMAINWGTTKPTKIAKPKGKR